MSADNPTPDVPDEGANPETKPAVAPEQIQMEASQTGDRNPIRDLKLNPATSTLEIDVKSPTAWADGKGADKWIDTLGPVICFHFGIAMCCYQLTNFDQVKLVFDESGSSGSGENQAKVLRIQEHSFKGCRAREKKIE